MEGRGGLRSTAGSNGPAVEEGGERERGHDCCGETSLVEEADSETDHKLESTIHGQLCHFYGDAIRLLTEKPRQCFNPTEHEDLPPRIRN